MNTACNCPTTGPSTRKCVSRQRGGSALPSQSRSEEHTSELQSPCNLVCRLLLEKKKHCVGELYTQLCVSSKLGRYEQTSLCDARLTGKRIPPDGRLSFCMTPSVWTGSCAHSARR